MCRVSTEYTTNTVFFWGGFHIISNNYSEHIVY